MTRARVYALAAMLAVCCLGHTSANAQSGTPDPQFGYAAPGMAPDGGSPDDCPLPGLVGESPWFGGVEDIPPSNTRVGPPVHFDGWFIRTEYLNWNISPPNKNTLLGAPVAGVLYPQNGFIAFAPGTNNPEAFAFVPTAEGITLNSLHGTRATIGANLLYGGGFEVSAFILARKESGFTFSGFGQKDLSPFGFPGVVVPEVFATSTTLNGQISDHVFIYNVAYTAVFQSQIWGAEANWFPDYDAADPWQFKPLMGGRYINFSERLTQVGVFQDRTVAVPPVDSIIGSQTTNNLWGAQCGFRAQVVTKYLEVGLTPKVLFLGDTAVANVFSTHFRSNNDPTVTTRSTTTNFLFGADVSTYATINLHPNLSIRGGYDLLALSHVARPTKSIIYNDNGPGAPPGIISKVGFADALIYGFSVAAELRF